MADENKCGVCSTSLPITFNDLSLLVPLHQWSQVRVTQVAPITDLLKPEIKSQIIGLYSTLLSYCPPSLEKSIKDNRYFSGSANSLKTVSRVDVRSTSYADAVRTVYLDGTISDGWHTGGKEQCFELNNGTSIQRAQRWFI